MRLADLLSARGVLAHPETIVGTRRRHLPDILLEWHGLSIAIECKLEAPGARAAVDEDAQRRLDANLAAVAIALVYPRELAEATDLTRALSEATFRVRFFAIGGRAGETVELTGVDDLARSLEGARAQLVSDASIEESVNLLDDAIEAFRGAIAQQAAREDELLRIVAAAEAVSPGAGTDEERRAAVSIAGLAICTAAMFHLELAKVDPAVATLPSPGNQGARRQWLRAWKRVLDHDYAAVFRIAVEVLEALSDDASLDHALTVADDAAREIATRRILGRHDLVGRIYHRLLADQKFLATYYTRVPSAALLSGLALDRERWPNVDWAADADDLGFTVGDFASGTGTLIVSAASAITQNWAVARADAGHPIDLQALGRHLIEDCLSGYDILAYAIQVCATTLLLGSPGSAVQRSCLYQMPFGGESGQLGSLELLYGEARGRLFGEERRAVIGLDQATEDPMTIGVPELHYVVMNPPFTRSVNSNRLLGSLSEAELEVARARLRQLMDTQGVQGTLTAGLAAPFISLGASAVTPGGRIALVLPKTFLTGQAWEPSRRLLAERFHVEDVIVSHEPGRWNFSDSTQLSETMIIARKLQGGESRRSLQTRWIQLRRNPRNHIESLSIVAAVKRAPLTAAGELLRVSDSPEGEVGEMFARRSPTDGSPWRHASFSTAALDQVAATVSERRRIALPGGTEIDLPLCGLGEIATYGFDTRDIHDAFEPVTAAQPYQGFWGHDASRVTAMAQSPNTELRARTTAAPGRSRIKPAAPIWATASRLLLVDRLWLPTQRCAAVVLDRPAVGPTWWELSLTEDDPRCMSALALWFNSTHGLLALLFSTEEGRGPWIKLKKNKLDEVTTLDVRQLSEQQLQALHERWLELSDSDLQPVSELDADPIRAAIDDALSAVVGIPPDALETLRHMLGREPRTQPVPRELAPGASEEHPDVPSLF